MSWNPIFHLALGPALTNVLFTANRLGMFDLLATRSMVREELAEELGVTGRAFPAFMDACAAIGLVRVVDGAYENSHLSDAYLVKGRPHYLGDFLEIQRVESDGWQKLYEVITHGGTADQFGVDMRVEPRRFTMAMDNLAMLGEAEALASAVDLSGRETMADVGCGSGMYSVALCRHVPGLHSTLLDRDDVLVVARQVVRQARLQDRISTRPADITEDSYGENLDVVLLSDVLYQNEDTCLTLLRSAHRALRSGGMLLVRGYFSDPGGSQPLFGAVFAVAMQLSGADRAIISIPVVRRWVEHVGFKDVNTFALTERSVGLTAVKTT